MAPTPPRARASSAPLLASSPVDRKAGKDAREAPVRRHDEERRGMGVAVVFGIIARSDSRPRRQKLRDGEGSPSARIVTRPTGVSSRSARRPCAWRPRRSPSGLNPMIDEAIVRARRETAVLQRRVRPARGSASTVAGNHSRRRSRWPERPPIAAASVVACPSMSVSGASSGKRASGGGRTPTLASWSASARRRLDRRNRERDSEQQEAKRRSWRRPLVLGAAGRDRRPWCRAPRRYASPPRSGSETRLLRDRSSAPRPGRTSAARSRDRSGRRTAFGDAGPETPAPSRTSRRGRAIGKRKTAPSPQAGRRRKTPRERPPERPRARPAFRAPRRGCGSVARFQDRRGRRTEPAAGCGNIPRASRVADCGSAPVEQDKARRREQREDEASWEKARPVLRLFGCPGVSSVTGRFPLPWRSRRAKRRSRRPARTRAKGSPSQRSRTAPRRGPRASPRFASQRSCRKTPKMAESPTSSHRPRVDPHALPCAADDRARRRRSTSAPRSSANGSPCARARYQRRVLGLVAVPFDDEGHRGKVESAERRREQQRRQCRLLRARWRAPA